MRAHALFGERACRIFPISPLSEGELSLSNKELVGGGEKKVLIDPLSLSPSLSTEGAERGAKPESENDPQSSDSHTLSLNSGPRKESKGRETKTNLITRPPNCFPYLLLEPLLSQSRETIH